MRLSTKGGLDLLSAWGDQTQSHVEPQLWFPVITHVATWVAGYQPATTCPESKSEDAVGLSFRTPRTQGFPTSALLIFGAKSFLVVGGCPTHGRTFSNIPDLSPQDASSTHTLPPKSWQPKPSPAIADYAHTATSLPVESNVPTLAPY